MRAEARLLAATGNVPFHDVTGKDYFEVALDIASNDFLLLETRLRTTRGGGVRAVNMEIEAKAYYGGAVEVNAAPDKPESQPRDGDLVLYSGDVIGSGCPAQNSPRA